jgi:hypothetical protein
MHKFFEEAHIAHVEKKTAEAVVAFKADTGRDPSADIETSLLTAAALEMEMALQHARNGVAAIIAVQRRLGVDSFNIAAINDLFTAFNAPLAVEAGSLLGAPESLLEHRDFVKSHPIPRDEAKLPPPPIDFEKFRNRKEIN